MNRLLECVLYVTRNTSDLTLMSSIIIESFLGDHEIDAERIDTFLTVTETAAHKFGL